MRPQWQPAAPRPLLRHNNPSDIDARSSDFNQGTALHIAAASLGLNAVRCLLEHGADPTLLNNKVQRLSHYRRGLENPAENRTRR